MQHLVEVVRTRKPKRQAFSPPSITEGMCGTCRYWHPDGDGETANCAVLAISHRRELKVKKQLPNRDTSAMGALQRAVVERTMAAMDGFEWREEGGGEVVPAEDFSDVPREFFDMNGDLVKVWSPLRSFAWGGCSRWDESGDRVIVVRDGEPVESRMLQKSLFGGDD